MAVLYISILLTFAVTLASGHVDFTGHKVLDIKTKTEQSLRDLLALEDELELDIWKLPRHQGDSMHVRVVPHELQALQAKLEELEADVAVWHEDVQRLIDESQPTKDNNLNRLFSLNVYNTYDTISTHLNSLASESHAAASLTKSVLSTTTAEGREIPYVKITSNDGTASTKQDIVMDCGIHAREWISPAFCMYTINELLADTEMLAKFNWYIIPVLNPDGYSYSHTNNRLWRKNRYVNNKNCIGVDLNRNFGYQWNPQNGGSTNGCSEIYAGTSAFSEPESIGLRDLVMPMVNNIAAYVTVHSYGQMWLYPWGYTTANTDRHQELGTVASAAVQTLAGFGTSYLYGTAAQVLYASAGGSDDWAFSEGIPFSYTLELRDTGNYGFVLPESQIMDTCVETYAALKTMALHSLV